MLLQAGLTLAVLLVMVGGAVRFHHTQNRTEAKGAWTGGAISWPKCFWLMYAIGAWFFLPWIFAFAPGISDALRTVLLIHVGTWWARGVIEGVMIFKWFNWSPVYGISHDGLHILFLFVGTVWAAAHTGWLRIGHPANIQALIFLSMTIFALTAEAVFAALFIATRGTSKDKVKTYFASNDPMFKLINRFTRAVCVIVYSALLLQIVWMAFLRGML